MQTGIGHVVTVALECTILFFGGGEQEHGTDRQTDGRTDGQHAASLNSLTLVIGHKRISSSAVAVLWRKLNIKQPVVAVENPLMYTAEKNEGTFVESCIPTPYSYATASARISH